MSIPQISAMLEACQGQDPLFPPTEIYQEKWLIRLVLQWLSSHPEPPDPLRPVAGARWFSEGFLPSAFLARKDVGRSDPLAETWTRGDGIVGHFRIGAIGKTDVEVSRQATQFTVCEAKIYSRLSKRVSKVPGYDQAARSVACIAETLARASRQPSAFDDLRFCVLAPQKQIDRGLFSTQMQKDSIGRKVRQRVASYRGQRDEWLRNWFEPTLERIVVECRSWEAVLKNISEADPEGGPVLQGFYDQCLVFCASKKERPAESDEDEAESEENECVDPSSSPSQPPNA